ncbi:MAG: TIGR02757 family protein [Acidobacteria bacterium]|nr:MAG: TIGR02757 family protein [Acidobacteriota bacterium]
MRRVTLMLLKAVEMRTGLPVDALRPALDRLYAGFNYPDSATDPIQIVRRFTRSDDREVVGFIAASLAFGRVTSVIQSIERVLAIAGPRPAEYVRRFDPRREKAAFETVVHRWTRGVDLMALISVMQQMIERSGSLEGFFADAYSASADDIEAALDGFSSRAMALDLEPAYGRVPRRPGVCYFFPRPSAGSGCKRLNLFLRWMVRRDALDLGVWSRISPAKLIVPLDTHVIRVGRCLGLTRYTSPGWPMARDITASLRRIDPDDPVKYDFALCHLGMMNACGFSRGPRRGRRAWDPDRGAGARGRAARPDANCPLRGLCRPTARRRARSR